MRDILRTPCPMNAVLMLALLKICKSMNINERLLNALQIIADLGGKGGA